MGPSKALDDRVSSGEANILQSASIPSTPPIKPAESISAGNGTTVVPNPTKEEKISNVELKKRRKAEKQARREQEKPSNAAGNASGQPRGSQGNKGDAAKTQSHGDRESYAKGPVQATKEEHKAHHKRSGSVTADTAKSLPVRGVAKRGGSTTTVPSGGSGEVALFGHLYGQPKRSSIAGAGRDIHPAILALGLQMSNYVICGSNARCVATLFCFKRVSRPVSWKTISY